MGTNYYTDIDTCSKCGRCEESIHLGKSSMGWWFHFNLNGERFYKNVPEMQEWLKGKKIYNEYSEEVSYEDFWKMVERKQKEESEPVEWQKEYAHRDPPIYLSIEGYSFGDCEFS